MCQISSPTGSGHARRRWSRADGIGRVPWIRSASYSRAKRAGLITAAALVGSLVAAMAGTLFTWNLTPSVPCGLYIRRPLLKPTLGAIVVFPVPAQAMSLVATRRYLPDGAELLKIVVALPGDEVCVAAGEYRVNGVAIAAVRTSDSQGRPLVATTFCGQVPSDQAFVATSAPLSFDSRYFGPVPLSTLTVVIPVWTYSR